MFLCEKTRSGVENFLSDTDEEAELRFNYANGLPGVSQNGGNGFKKTVGGRNYKPLGDHNVLTLLSDDEEEI